MAKRKSFKEIMEAGDNGNDFSKILSATTSLYDDEETKKSTKSTTTTKSSTSKSSSSSYTRHKFSEVKAFSPLSEKDVNNYFTSANTLYSEMYNNYNSDDLIGTGKKYSSYADSVKKYQDQVNSIKSYYNANRDSLGEDKYNEGIKGLETLTNNTDEILNSYKSASTVKQEDIDALEAYKAKQAEYERLLNLDLEEQQKLIDEEENRIAANGRGSETFNNYSAQLIEIDKKRLRPDISDEEYAALSDEYDRIYELRSGESDQEKLNQLKTDYELANRYQYGKTSQEFVDSLPDDVRELMSSYYNLKNSGAIGTNSISVMEEIKNKTGWDTAAFEEAYDKFEWVNDEEYQKERTEYFQEYAAEHPNLATALSVGTNLLSGIGQLDMVTQQAANEMNGSNRPINLNSQGMTALNTTEDIRNQVISDLASGNTKVFGHDVSGLYMPEFLGGQNVGEFGYSTLTSMIDSAANMIVSTALTGGMGLTGEAAKHAVSGTMSLIMGSQVAATESKRLIESGAPAEEALTMGAIYGAIEGISETFSVESIIDAIGSDKKVWQKLIKSFLAEGGEEVESNWLGRLVEITDHEITGRESEFVAVYNAYRQNGDSDIVALGKAFRDFLPEDASVFLAGGLSGLAMGSTYQAIDTAEKTSYYSQLGKEANAGGQRADVIDYEKTNGSEKYKALAEKLEKSKRKKNVALGKLTADMQQGIGTQFEEVDSYEAARQAYMKATESGNETVGKLASEQFANTTIPMLMRENGAQQPAEAANSSAEEFVEQKQNTAQTAKSARKTYAATMDGNTVTVEDITLDSRKGDTRVILSDGSKVDLGDVKFGNTATEQIFQAASQFDGKSARVFLHNYDGSSPLDLYTNTFKAFNTAGRTGMTWNDAMQKFDGYAKIVGEEKAQVAFNSGSLRRKEEASSVQSVKAVRAGTGTYQDHANVQNEAMRPIYQKIAQRYGLTVERVESLGDGINGTFLPAEMKIQLSQEADSKELQTMFHELGEFALSYDRTEYKAFQRSLLNWWATENNREALGDLDALVEDYQAAYQEKEGEKTYEEALDELTNDALFALFNSEESMKAFVEHISADESMSAEEKRTFIQKIADVLKKIIDDIKEFLKSQTLGRAAQELAKADMKSAEQLRNMLLDLLDNAAYQAQKTGEYLSKQEERYSIEVNEELKKVPVNREIMQMISDVKKGKARANEKVYLGIVSDDIAEQIQKLTQINVSGFNIVLEARQINHIIKNHGEHGKANHSMSDDETIAKMKYVLEKPDDIRNAGKTKAYTYMKGGRNRTADTVLYEKKLGEKSYYVVQAIPDTAAKSVYVVTAFIGKEGYKKETSQLINAQSLDVTAKTGSVVISKNSIAPNEATVKSQFTQKEEKHSIDVDELKSENRKLLRQNQNYERMIASLVSVSQIEQKKHLNSGEINAIARKYKNHYNSSLSVSEIFGMLKPFFEKIANAEPGELSQQWIQQEAEKIMRPIIENSKDNNKLSAEAEEILKDIRGYKIKLNETQKQQAAYYSGNYNNFKKASFSYLTIRNEGTPLDIVWSELSNKYPWFFDAETADPDQPVRLLEVVNALKEDYQDESGFDINDAVSYAAADMFDTYLGVSEIKDAKSKYNAEILKLRSEARQMKEDLKQQYKEEYQRKLKEIEQNTRWQIADERLANQMWTGRQLARMKAKMEMRMQDELKKRTEVDEMRKAQKNILKDAKDLATWLTKPNNQKHIPEDMRSAVGDMLAMIAFDGVGNSKQTKGFVAAIRRAVDECATGDFAEYADPDMKVLVKNFLNRFDGGASLSELDLQGMRDLAQILKMVKSTVTARNKAFGNELSASISELGEQTIDYLSEVRYRKLTNKVFEGAQKIIDFDMSDPKSFFDRLGPVGESLWKEFRQGLDQRTWDIKAAQSYAESLMKSIDKKKLKDIREEGVRFEAEYGTLYVTKAQLMSLYLLNKRQQAQGHIYTMGVRALDKAKKMKNSEEIHQNSTEPITFTLLDIAKVPNYLSAEEMALADELQKFLSDNCATWGNEVSMKLYGYKKFTEEHYFPIRSNSNETQTKESEENKQGKLNAILNMGMTKQTVEDASNSIILDDVFSVFTDHVTKMATYHAWAIPIYDAIHWYNYNGMEKTENSKTGSTVKAQMERVHGKAAGEYFLKFIQDINGASEQANITTQKFIDKMISRYKSVAIGANLRVAVQQPTSYVRAAAVISPKYLTEALKIVPNPKEMKRCMEAATEHCAIAQWKNWGYFETSIGKSMEQLLFGSEKMIDKITDKSMYLTEKGDELTWATLWKACELEVKATQNGLNEVAFNDKVAERLSEIIDLTQVVDTPLHRSQLMRSQDRLTKITMSFMAEPTKSFNMLRNATEDVLNTKKGSPEQKEKLKKFGRVMMTFFCSSIATAAAAALVDAMQGDDEEKDFWEKYTSALLDNSLDNLSVFSMLPVAKDILSIIEGYDVKRMDMEGIQSVIQTAQEWIKFFKGESKKTLPQVIYQTTKSASYIAGVPVYNVERDLNAVIQTIFGWSPLKGEPTNKQKAQNIAGMLESDTSAAKKKIQEEVETYTEEILAENPSYTEEKAKQEAESKVRSILSTYYKDLYLDGTAEEQKQIENELKNSELYDDVAGTLLNWKVSKLKKDYIAARNQEERNEIRNMLWKTGKWKKLSDLDKQIKSWISAEE